MKILVINGPNINMLGIREPEIYGNSSFSRLLELLQEKGKQLGIQVDQFQSNHEGSLVDQIQQAYGNYDALVINPAAYTHTSIAIADALKAVGIPTVEVHISDVDNREDFRKISFTSPVCIKTIKGLGLDGYLQAIQFLYDRFSK